MFRKLPLALAAPLLLITACASAADPGALEVRTGSAAVAALRGAPDALASEAGTAAFEMQLTISGTAGEQVQLVATGAFDADAQQMAMEMDLGGVLGREAAPGADQPLRFVVDGATVYVRMPVLDALTASSGWLSATPEDLGQDAGAFGLATSAYDPSTFLEVLRGVADDVEVDGSEDVRGVPTTRYTATVSLDRALDQAPADRRDELEAQLDELGTSDADIAVEAWVDADGLVRRITMAFDGLLGTVGLGYDPSMEIAIELYDYGEPVAIEVPPPDEVTPFADVMGGLGEAIGAAGS